MFDRLTNKHSKGLQTTMLQKAGSKEDLISKNNQVESHVLKSAKLVDNYIDRPGYWAAFTAQPDCCLDCSPRVEVVLVIIESMNHCCHWITKKQNIYNSYGQIIRFHTNVCQIRMRGRAIM